MDKLSFKIKAELENIDEIFKEMPSYTKLPYLSTLELAGTAALLHDFYNGIENIIKQILLAENISIPDGKSWHRELLEKAVEEEIVSKLQVQLLSQYLAFRHFFSHGYALDLYHEKMEPLVKNLEEVYSDFKNEIEKYIA